jgi:hypothetical protein
VGDPVADRVLSALRVNGATSQSGLSDLFGRNLSAARLSAALETLLKLGKVKTHRVETLGRPSTLWEAIPRATPLFRFFRTASGRASSSRPTRPLFSFISFLSFLNQ